MWEEAGQELFGVSATELEALRERDHIGFETLLLKRLTQESRLFPIKISDNPSYPGYGSI